MSKYSCASGDERQPKRIGRLLTTMSAYVETSKALSCFCRPRHWNPSTDPEENDMRHSSGISCVPGNKLPQTANRTEDVMVSFSSCSSGSDLLGMFPDLSPRLLESEDMFDKS